MFRKKARLIALDMEIPLRWNQTFTDLGFQECEREDNNDKQLQGLCTVTNRFGFQAVQIKYAHTQMNQTTRWYEEFGETLWCDTRRSPRLYAREIHVRAHEETHAIEYLMSNLDILAEQILARNKVDIEFNTIHNREVRAEIGAISALDYRGIDYHKKEFIQSNKETEKAIEVYDASKIPPRCYVRPDLMLEFHRYIDVLREGIVCEADGEVF